MVVTVVSQVDMTAATIAASIRPATIVGRDIITVNMMWLESASGKATAPYIPSITGIIVKIATATAPTIGAQKAVLRSLAEAVSCMEAPLVIP